MKDDKIVLYMHAGSGNHGCEAIVNSLCRMLPKPAILMTNRPKAVSYTHLTLPTKA